MLKRSHSQVCGAAAVLLALGICCSTARAFQEDRSPAGASKTPGIAGSELAGSGLPAVGSRVITLARGAEDTVAGKTNVASSLTGLRGNYREFETVKVSESSRPESFVLQFHGATKVTGISARGDFQVTGGNCSEGRAYLAGESCELQVTFTPSGPGHRTGQLKVEHTAEFTPFLAPLGGTGYGSAISFTPSAMSTVPGSFVSSTVGGLISGPGQLAMDGGDDLYIADPGNHLIRFRDSSGVIKTLIGGGTVSLTTSSGFGTQIKLSAPTGVVVDSESNVYFSDSTDNLIAAYFLDDIALRIVGGGTTDEIDCYTSAMCTPSNVLMDPPTSLAIDSSGNVFSAATYGRGLPGSELGELSVSASPEEFYIAGTTAYNYYSSSNAITADPFGYGNLYYTYLDPGTGILSPTPLCYVIGQNSSYTQNLATGDKFWKVAGSGPCGFSGDGGRASSAEISKAIGQFAWDAAGNFYFTDTGNNRVRRVDGTTGVIRTIAGNGNTGYGGNGGPSTLFPVQTPVGLATDSTGRVYVTAVAAVSNKYEIQVFGGIGALNFGEVTVAARTAALTVLVSNVGNQELNFTHEGFTSGNTGDFATDTNTTTCNFTVPLASGASCYVGFTFAPTAAGGRSAVYSLLDDTVTGSNTIQLAGTGATTATLTPTPVAFASRAVGSASTATVVTLKNTGTGILTISTGGITISGTNATSFSETTTCGTTLAAAASCTISVIYKPTVTGSLTATLKVVDNAINGSQSVTLTGTATAAAVKATLTPGAVTFDPQMVKTASVPTMISITNSSSEAMTLNSFAITGANAAAFTESHGCGGTVAAGAKCTISVVFQPKAVGSQAATLTVATSAGALTAALQGTGKASLRISPKPVEPRPLQPEPIEPRRGETPVAQ